MKRLAKFIKQSIKIKNAKNEEFDNHNYDNFYAQFFGKSKLRNNIILSMPHVEFRRD